MLPTFVIGLREGVEAALIVGILAAFVRRRGRPDVLPWIWAGVGLAVALCLGVGIALWAVEESLPQREQEQLETVIAAIAVGFVTYMVIWMRRHARALRQSIEGEASDALARNSASALVVMAFLAVLREGFETSVFLLAVFRSASDTSSTAAGVVLGLTAAAALGYGLYRGGARLNLGRFFRVTGLVLVLVAAGLASSALHTAHEAGWFNALQSEALDLRWLVAPGTVRAALLTGMLGLEPRPTLGEVLIWLLIAAPLLLYVIWPASAQPVVSRMGQLLRRGAATTALSVLAILIVACGSGDDDIDLSGGGTHVIHFTLTDAGCEPDELVVPAGPAKFTITNDGAEAVTELELMDGERVLGEAENLTPGLSGTFTVDLAPGTYTLYCPNGTTAERGTLTVSDATPTP